MKSFQHLAEKKRYRSARAMMSLFGKNTIDHLQYSKKTLKNSEKTLKRFHPTGQTEASMAGVIRGSR
ncbi:hypothetical protein D3OALGA1CA_3986 [Olavius algarvensis associated proteobacterium Delta 3]|nr:hypothetical protein D3OALGB2SA_3385 [Olavius algarvensis associated proteobacterium Delta 3]CAB5143266.1 hypothetical protein D3OALGA1CA_3986 [Olavius algarvensis associated proteobacterium Delta 3]